MILKVRPIYIVIVLILFTVLSYLFIANSLENTLQDKLLQSTKASNKSDMRISIIGIDDESLAKLGRWQDWKRNYYADIINILAKGKPAAIGVDIIFSDKGDNTAYDQELVNAVKNAKNVVLPVYADYGNTIVKDIRKSGRKIYNMVEPFPDLKKVSILGHINMIPDQDDSVVRTFLSTYTYKNQVISSFDYQLYKEYLKSSGQEGTKINIPKEVDGSTYVDFVAKAGEFEKVPFYKVLNGEIPPEYFQDRIVLVGPYAIGMDNDLYLSPLDHQVKMYGIEIHANILQGFLNNTFKKYATDWVNLLIILVFAFAGYFLFKKFGPFKSAIAVVIIAVLYIFAAQYFYSKGVILSILYPLFVLIAVFLAELAFQYIKELLERKRITNVFGRYVAPQVVKEILKNGEEGLKLGGTRREISALFVDIRGFTPMSEKCQPEEVVEILNDYLNLTATSIFKYNGTLDKFIGDATMAIFNAPLDMEDHPFKAVQTAWAMKEGSEILRVKLQEKFGRSVQFGIGVNTGFAVVGNIGSKARMDYTAIGDTVNTAARLESNAKPGQILLSETTYEFVKDRIESTYLGEIKVKGKEQGVPIYQLDGIKV